MNANHVSPSSRQEYRLTLVLSYIVATAMLACLTFALVQLSHRVFPGWENDYLLVVSAVVAIEAMLAERSVRDYALLTPEWLLHRLTEWVVLLVLLKVLLYLLHDPAQILADVLEWDERFFETFFTPEYAAVILASLLIWLLAIQFGGFFLDFEASVDELEQESQGMVVKDRSQMRHALEMLIFGVGILMMILMAFTHARVSLFAPPRVSLRVSVLVLLLYFFLGFILLAQSQFFIQRARWYLQNIPASPKIGQRWAVYSLLLIGLIAALVSLLPTGYSADFFLWLQTAIGFLMGIVVYLFLIIITPFLYLLQLLASLFRPGLNLRPNPVVPPALPPVDTGDPDPYWLLIKSLFFWTVFFSVIVFSFRYYIRQHPAAWEQVKQRPVIRALVRVFEWLSRSWRRTRRRVGTAVETGVESLRSATARSLRLPDMTRLARRLPPRAQVLLIYREMLRWNARNGVSRRRNQTPAGYGQMLSNLVPTAQPEIETLTNRFIEARYTRHELRAADADQVRDSWRRLKHSLRIHLGQLDN